MRLCWVTLTLMVVGGASARRNHHKHNKLGRALAGSAGLQPAPANAETTAEAHANATCGDSGPEDYCRELPAKRGTLCDVCDSGSPSRRHPLQHALDDDPATWWQSPSLANGDRYNHVSLTFTFPDELELMYVILKAGPSPRPLAWSLEISTSPQSDDWSIVRTFGDRDQCWRLWGLRPERRRRRARAAKVAAQHRARRKHRADNMTCSTQFSSPRPLQNGEMHVGLGEGVPALRVRVSLRATHPASPEQRYYTLRSVVLGARCRCHGHAERCDFTPQGSVCECQHGTCGRHCDHCCLGENWAPSRPCSHGSQDIGVESKSEECSCAERGACAFDDSGAILCVNCKDNRAGPLCDRCLSGFYSTHPDGACKPCPCHPSGSDGTCKWNKGRNEVICNCLDGFSGSLCDSCANSLSVFPNCPAVETTPYCKCDPRGIIDSNDVCANVCQCKVHVTGETCNTCKIGYYGLSKDLADGCRACYCSGATDLCAADPDPGDTVELPLGETSWLVVDAELNQTISPSIDEAGHPYFIIYEVEGWSGFFWLTESWNGTQLEAYGGAIAFTTFWNVMRGDTGGVPTIGPDVILIANDGTQIASANTSHKGTGSMEISVPLVEDRWYQLSSGQGQEEVLTRKRFMEVLSEVRALMLRAQFHLDEDEVRLEQVRLVGAAGGTREVCACPAGHDGAHCERCAWGHVALERAPASLPSFECAPCACNGHADCDTVEGECGECQHNTTGAHCERCLPGYYGNPTLGGCRQCACPLLPASNNFSPNCALAAAEGEEYVCTQCPPGYSGEHCETCDFGYWGSPTTAGGACSACACDGSPCDQTTGECLKCPPHAGGARCDQCEEGYWQDPDVTLEARVGVTCQPCGCGPGALSPACDQRSGQCACRAGWAGRACDRCDIGHGNVELGCPPCRCGVAALSPSCDQTSGFCQCGAGAAPPSCDACLPDHYGLTDSGCIGCNCSSVGAEANSCDIRSGQCRCRPHVAGRLCDRCEEGYWGLSSTGCKPCECGAGAAACDQRTGGCACATGVGGTRCDTCLPGHYGFGPAGCLRCPECGAGKVCDAGSGRCVCPARSRGAGCRDCAPGHWRAPDGCRPCDCGAGALNGTCDVHNGQCWCRAGWAGRACDACASGHHGPRCRPCACHPAGTRTCAGSDLCPCDDSGQCDCKDNVEGEKCDICRAGTFGLTVENPAGCTACFCFGRSAHCSQAGLTRAAIHAAAPRVLTITHHQGNTRHHEHLGVDSLPSLPADMLEASLPAPQPAVPVYMELDQRFVGDRVTSYGGLLKFTVQEEGGEELPEDILVQYPLVRLHAGHNIVLNFFQRDPSSNGTHYVRFHESLWRARAQHASEAVASRAALMVALSDLRRILVRVTTRTPTQAQHVKARLLNISLDTAIPGEGRSAPALGVELCACPKRYASSSCQQPAVGFWQPPPRLNVHHVAGTIVINLEGEAQPCFCNGRAHVCDPITGHCLNCSDGTGGARCEICAEGFYGTPETGCQACPCPERTRNFASSCIFSENRLQCLCKPGYAGAECESCAPGWWQAGDGACAACGCDPRGSLTPHCDHYGRCRCRDFAAGHKCDRCKARRMFFGENDCQQCDNCSQTLLDVVEELEKELQTKVNTEDLSRIPKPYTTLEQFHTNYTILATSLDNVKDISHTAKQISHRIEKIENKVRELKALTETIKSELAKQEDKAQFLSLESMSGLEQILGEKVKLAATVAELDEFARGERHMSAHRALKEARHLLQEIRRIQLIDYVSAANDVSDSANLQSTAVKELNYRVDHALGRAKNSLHSLDQWHMKVNDLSELIARVWRVGDRITDSGERTRPRLSALKDTHLRTRLVLEDLINLNNNNFTNETVALISEARLLLAGIPTLSSELATLMAAAEEKEGILYNLTPAYRKKYVEAAERHVAELHAKAQNYASLFAEALGGAAAGVEASRAWARVLAELQAATAAADAALAAARRAGKVARGPLPLEDRARAADSVSARLKTEGQVVLNKSDELRAELERLRRGTERVSVALRGLGWQERELAAPAPPAVGDALRRAGEQADRVFSSTRVLYDEARQIQDRARYHLRPQLADLQRHGDTALGAAQEHVSQIRGNTLKASEVASALEDAAAARAQEHRAADSALGPDMAQLRDKIAKARHAADSISVSLTSLPGESAGCSRSYLGSVTPAAITRISLAISFDGTVRDGPLLWMGNPEDPEDQTFLQVLVKNQKLQLTWNLGDGDGVIEHPEVLRAAHDDLDHTSYKIDIERVWSTVRLSTERLGGGSGAPAVASNATGTLVSFFAPELWLGSPEDTAGLPGCVHALYFDDKRLGLWKFVSQPQESYCTGCTQRWYGGGGGGATLAWFGGEGYAELRRSELRPPDRRHFSVALAFRTKDENAALFVAHDAINNRSVSVSLRSCRVVFRVEYAAAALEIVAAGRHCHGRPVHVQAIRVFAKNNLEKGSLRVNGEETLGSPEPPVQDAAALPDLTNAPYWLGGVPPGAPLTTPPLLGCLGALMVDREGYDPLNTPHRYGVEPRCGNRVLRSVVLEGSGWVELPSPNIRRRTAVGLSFMTQQPRGLLLLRAPSTPESDNEVEEEDTDDQHYLSLALVDGEIELTVAAGKSELRLRTNGSALTDGSMHTVRIVRAHKQLELWVDEARAAHGALAGGAIEARARGLYLGGVPAHLNATERPQPPAFSGTIADLIVDGTLIGMENAVNWSGARLGRTQRDSADAPRAAPRPLHAPANNTLCTKSASYTVEAGAVKFGDSAHSFAMVRAARARDLALSLQFRTFRPDGLLLLAPGSKSKPKHYLALSVREGRLRLVVRGRRRRELHLDAAVADGVWRSVAVRVSPTRLVLASAGAASTGKPPRKLGLGGRLYVGGLPDTAAIPNVPDSISRASGFIGCVRRVAVNGRAEDLVRDVANHHRVGQCFPRVEPAAFFAGDAHATWAGAWDGAGGAELRVDFRTADANGVLLVTRQFVLEIRDGALVLTRRSAAGDEATVQCRGVAESALCDDVWHEAAARVSAGALELSVDAGPARHVQPGRLLADDSDSPTAPVPLYVGGLPESGNEWWSGRDNFKGCLRAVVVSGERRDWTKMQELHNVLIDSCPVPH